MWTCANCGVMNKVCLKEANLIFDGVERGYLEAAIGDEINIAVELPDALAGATLSIDTFTPLPKGLVFENNTIKGKLEEDCNVFIHVIAEKDGTKTGSSFQLFAPKKIATKSGGCGGQIETTIGLVGLLAAAGIIILAFDRKRKARI